MGGLGAASGALLGGLLTQIFGWPAIFLINVPLGAVVVALGARVLIEGRREGIPRHFDVAGAVLVTLGLVGVTFGIVRSEAFGWGSAQVLGPIVAGVLLLALFVLVEGRFARVPLVPISIFRLRALRAANLVVVLMYAALFSMWFFLTLYLQQVLHYDALEAGLAFVPMTLGVVTGSTLAPRMIARSSVREHRSGPAHRRPARRGISARGSPRRDALHHRNGAFPGVGDDRRRPRGPGERERPGLGPAQHLAAGGRRARARGARHDR
jgi:predicted MFS family arabinose efflux permease